MPDMTWETCTSSELTKLTNRKQYRYAKFLEDMEDAGYDVEAYRGRGGFDGPAVRIENLRELQDAIRATDVRVRWDGMGLGLIVYPE